MIGGGAALVSLPVHLLLSAENSAVIASLMLAIVAAIYVGFALADGRSRIMATEIGVAALFSAAALCGLLISRWVVVGAYLLHGFWDFAHHRRIETAMPRWYIPFCALFDWLFAAGLALIILLKT